MLDLEPRIQLDEVVRASRSEQELERARIEVGNRMTRARNSRLHHLARRFVECRRRRFLDQLLVPALDRAFPLAEREHAAVGGAEDLDLAVPGRSGQRLE